MRVTLILISIFFTFNLCLSQNRDNKSETLTDYYKLGLPDIEKEWTETDLQKSFDILKGLKKSDTFSLPKLDSKTSSAIFDKIIHSLPEVNPQDSLNLTGQFDNYRAFKDALPDLSALYGGASENEYKFYSNELIEIVKRVIVESTNASKLYFDHYSIELEDSEDTRIRTDRFSEGSFKVFSGALNMNGPLSKYHMEDKLGELAKTVSLNLKKIWKNMAEEYKSELLKKIEYFSEKSESYKVRKIFSKLVIDLKESK